MTHNEQDVERVAEALRIEDNKILDEQLTDGLDAAIIKAIKEETPEHDYRRLAKAAMSAMTIGWPTEATLKRYTDRIKVLEDALRGITNLENPWLAFKGKDGL